MPSPKLIQTVAIFILAFLFGIGWVGAFHYLGGIVGQEKSASRHKDLSPDPIGFGTGTEDRPVSMNDAGFTPPQVDQQNPEAFDPEGIYTIKGSAPQGFEDLGAVVVNNKILDVDCDHEDFGKLVKPTGFVYFSKDDLAEDSGVRHEFRDIDISNGRMDFATTQAGGTAYEFSGEFLYKGNFYTVDPDASVLTGKISKLVDGKKVAETDVDFTWSIDLTCVC